MAVSNYILPRFPKKKQTEIFIMKIRNSVRAQLKVINRI